MVGLLGGRQPSKDSSWFVEEEMILGSNVGASSIYLMIGP